jgi:hypothetical protein
MRRKKLVISLEVGAVLNLEAAKKVTLVRFEDGSWVGDNVADEERCLRGHVGTIEQVTVNVVQAVKPAKKPAKKRG